MTFSFEALYFLGTLPFPQALCTRWGSWVTWLEISISPQNKKPERDIIIFARRCGFPLHQKHSCWFYGKLYEFTLKMERFEFWVPAEDTMKSDAPASVYVCIYIWCARERCVVPRGKCRIDHMTLWCACGVWHNNERELRLEELLMKNTRVWLTRALE